MALRATNISSAQAKSSQKPMKSRQSTETGFCRGRANLRLAIIIEIIKYRFSLFGYW